MTQTAHVAAREAVSQILREAFRLRLELRPKTLRSGAALLYERIYESLIPLRKANELQRRRIALDSASTCAPSTPEPSIRNRISHPIRDISSCTSRARASCTSRPRALGVYGCVRIWDCSRRPWGRFSTTNRRRTAEHWKQGSLISEGKGEPFRAGTFSASPAPNGCPAGAQRA